ncbi:hypothetical protein [Pyxidicoccus caerfyrddinensis]|nr:hypothetical protein [Pyxidicoccus caerfyrddinensis]
MQIFVGALSDFPAVDLGEPFTNGSTKSLGTPLPCPRHQGWMPPDRR